MDMGLQDKVAIVTGGSYGIGKAAALSMAREGARVILVARRPDVLDEAVQDIKTATEGIALPVVGDVSDKDAADRVVKTALDRFGRVDILVNNAGASMANAVFSTMSAGWRASSHRSTSCWSASAAGATRTSTSWPRLPASRSDPLVHLKIATESRRHGDF